MHFINNRCGVGIVACLNGSFQCFRIFFPSFWIGGCHVDDGASQPVYAHSLGKYTRCLAESGVERVELSEQVASYLSSPYIAAVGPHVDGSDGLSASAAVVETQYHLFFLSFFVF